MLSLTKVKQTTLPCTHPTSREAPANVVQHVPPKSGVENGNDDVHNCTQSLRVSQE